MEWKNKDYGNGSLKMQEALNLIKSSNTYKKIFKEIYKKYRKYGKITGSFTIKAESSDDVNVLLNFDTRVVYESKAVIKSSLVEELFKRKLKNSTFIELMEAVLQSEATTNQEEKIKKTRKQNDFFEYILKNSKEGRGYEWFKFLREEKSCGYNAVMRKYNECTDKDQLKKLQANLILANDSLSSLPCFSGKKENIAVFSANMTKDPHFFDYNTYTGKLLVSGIGYIFNKDIPKTLDGLNELYYEAGILKDEISNHSTIGGFSAYDNNDCEIMPIGLFSQWNEPLEISMSNLLKIDYLKCHDDKVFVFENPSVFSKLLKLFGNNVSLICTSGQLNLSAYMIIDKIKDLKSIYYAGDFDPEGLIIADKIKLKYGDKVKFMLYDGVIYDKIKSSNEINEARLSMLDKIKSQELQGIKNYLKKEKKPAYQELLTDEYARYIENEMN